MLCFVYVFGKIRTERLLAKCLNYIGKISLISTNKILSRLNNMVECDGEKHAALPLFPLPFTFTLLLPNATVVEFGVHFQT